MLLYRILFFAGLAPNLISANPYNLVVNYQQVNLTGKKVQAMSINGSIPGPKLIFKEGEVAVINVTNKMKMPTSMHWHGLLVPNREDGAPFVTSPPIAPGETYTFRIPLRQSGTYWYHSHTGLQEQRGVYGSIVIHPKEGPAQMPEQMLVLSDWSDKNPHEILRTLKSGNHYYAVQRGTLTNLWGAVSRGHTLDYLSNWWKRMPPMDIADVAYDRFLINGKSKQTITAPAGKVRLRLVNAGASTYFYVQFGGLPFTVVATDGLDIQPFQTTRLLVAVAETYDIVVDVKEGHSTEFRATAQDGSGHASVFFNKGKMKHWAPDIPRPNLYVMNHDDHHQMGDHNAHKGHEKHKMHEMHKMHQVHSMAATARPLAPYKQMKALASTLLPAKQKWREVKLRLTGDMQRYIWSFNNKTINEEDKILVKRGENVRFILVNETMMHHPIHLHGHYFRVVNQHGELSPLKHTVDVPPMSRQVIEFDANEEKDWFFHCHILYHMKGGMSRLVSYQGDTLDANVAAIRPLLFKDPWYFWARGTFTHSMSEGAVHLANTRNQIKLNSENGWQKDDDFDVILSYDRYVSRFFQPMFGVFTTRDIVDEKQYARAFVGYNYLLPLFIESYAWVDHRPGYRVGLRKEIELTNRIHNELHVEYDQEEGFEWAAFLSVIVMRNFEIKAGYHSQFEWAVGGTLIF